MSDDHGFNGALSPADETGVSGFINLLCGRIGLWAKSKGWREAEPRNPLVLSALIHTEVSELVEGYRHGNPMCDKPGLEGMSNAAEELADIVIRVCDFADEHGIDLGDAVIRKLAVNQKRPHRHGGKAH